MASVAFKKIRREARSALVRADYGEALAGALIEGEGCTPLNSAGRGTVMRFDYGGGVGVVREYLRGGVVRHLLRDAYLMANRPLREFRVHRHVEEAGLSVPELLGVCWEWRGPFVQGAIATGYVEGLDLEHILGEAEELPRELLGRCGVLIREMHDLGVWHADLQVRNILVSEEKPVLIDFDGAVLRRRLSDMQRARNLLRLRRSIEKNGLPLDAFRAVCDGYGDVAFPAWLDRLYRAKASVSDILQGRGT